jgi:hypothetical protein
MTTYQILYWHNIPSQVRAREGRERVSVALSAPFQEAIDAAAMASGLLGSDEYTEAFRWGDIVEADGTPRDVAERVAAELETTLPGVDPRATAARIKASRSG